MKSRDLKLAVQLLKENAGVSSIRKQVDITRKLETEEQPKKDTETIRVIPNTS
jgi:hypothetical protein